jgi:thioredoxin-related protein
LGTLSDLSQDLFQTVKMSARAPLRKIFLLSALAMTAWHSIAQAAELVMFEQAGCSWCEAFDREIAPIYPKTDEGKRAPLRRVDIMGEVPPDLAFLSTERITPLFILVDRGREIGRIRGYPGDDHFWGLLSVMVKRLNDSETAGEPARSAQKNLPVRD